MAPSRSGTWRSSPTTSRRRPRTDATPARRSRTRGARPIARSPSSPTRRARGSTRPRSICWPPISRPTRPSASTSSSGSARPGAGRATSRWRRRPSARRRRGRSGSARPSCSRGRHFRIVDLLELGDVRAAFREMELQSKLADELHQPLYQWHRAFYQAMRALLEGRFEEGEQLANEALEFGQRASQDAMETFGVPLFSARRDQGRLAEPEASAAAFVEQQPEVPGWRAVLACLYTETGRDADARRELETIAGGGLAALPEDSVWAPTMAMLSEVCAGLGDSPRAAELYDLLLPYAGRNVVVGAGVACSGAVSSYLGLLAATMKRWVEATLHFESGLEMNARIGARP